MAEVCSARAMAKLVASAALGVGQNEVGHLHIQDKVHVLRKLGNESSLKIEAFVGIGRNAV